ncbi:MAG TPA: ABC-F family ATP-binding cassette domain-containing protein [Bacillota bacterium]|jgi:ATP-binding cassette subfamily F protein 3|nr:ABC-F family ATP-binding cassette domain-containing protein [Fastidiosipila sp.]HPX93725.1 ABC-F family ATP-binding cassette domain-containing protein [Bacillota bacterium]HQB81473.1 ABC-F family ATP-binding cassette domain-containing protein [Bacillota bacterium]
MSIVQASDLSKGFLGRPVLEGLSFAIDASDKIGLIGQNGTGKTTLLNLISGTLLPDSGTIRRSFYTAVSKLGQRPLAYDHQGLDILDNPRFIRMEERMQILRKEMERTSGPALDGLVAEFGRLQQAMEDGGAYDYRARLARNLAGLGLTEKQMNQPYHTLSGGEQMRVSLGRLLLEPCDLLLLDEPTNHLDYDGLDWLQEYLLSKKTALVVVSHDRWFLDHVAGRIFELENHGLHTYRGNYSQAMEQKRERKKLLGLTMDRLSGEIKRQEGVAQTMRSHRKMKSYHSREKVVRKLKDQLSQVQSQVNPDRHMTFSFLPADTKKDRNRLLIKAENLSMAFDRPLFEDLSFTVKASDRIALAGPNGCGKTTLLHILLGRMEAVSGRISLYGDPGTAFMGQSVDFPDQAQTVYQYLKSTFPASETQIRGRLARFGFGDEALIKQLTALSGGERHRLYLCALLEQKADLLVLDEPTNHLDIESRELLEQTLADYHGAVLVVSHDRYFIRTAARSVLGFVGTEVLPFDSYEDWYRQYSLWREKEEGKAGPGAGAPANAAEVRRQRAKWRQALGRIQKEIEVRERACRLFEEADASGHRPEDYERYAELLAELEGLYQRYVDLEERAGES